MIRLIVQVPADLKAAIEAAKPTNQSRAEWIRESIRQRLDQRHPLKATNALTRHDERR